MTLFVVVLDALEVHKCCKVINLKRPLQVCMSWTERARPLGALDALTHIPWHFPNIVVGKFKVENLGGVNGIVIVIVEIRTGTMEPHFPKYWI